MTVYQILCILGVPALVAGILKVIFSQIKGVKLGVQALLRSQMIDDYNKWADRGYAPIYARENFQNCWKQYHALGANGVMDDIHNKFLMLPIEPPKKEDNNESQTQ
jgi:hypothetical protein